MQKVILKLELHDEKIRQKAFMAVSGFPGVDSVAIDRKDEKLTVVGDIDIVIVVKKLRKICHTHIVSVGPAKEQEKKPDQKKPDLPVIPVVPPNYYYYWYANTKYMDEDPNSCIIC